ncbi:MAG: NUDIX hydrolase [Methylococcaceae bacterium]|nr:NUDIX hydrolase [Methylococcaceae bacterium]
MSEANPWRLIASREIYDNPWIRVREDEVINPGGGKGLYGCVSFKNQAVGVIPLDDAGNTWLVGQYRYTLDAYSWEIPTGGSPPGEAVLETARRELKEETGLSASRWSPFLRLHLSNSVTDEEAYIFVAEDLTEGRTSFEETEQLMVRKLAVSDALDMVFRGEITDAISVAGLLKLACSRSK